MKDEIADNIASELRLIREELQKLTGALIAIANQVTELQQIGKVIQGAQFLAV